MLSPDAIASAMGVPRRTAVRWLRVWHALGVEGIHLVPSRGRYGRRYLVEPAVLKRWLDCELPAPHASAA